MVSAFRTRRALLAAATLAALPLAQGRSDEKLLRIVTSSLPPLVVDDGGAPGAVYELVIELCRRVQLTPKTEFVPWNRAMYLANTMPAIAIFPVSRLREREPQFRWLAPLYEENYVLMAHRDQFDLNRPGRMKARRIATLRGSTLIAALKEMGYLNIIEAATVDDVFRYLAGGIADAAFGERVIVRNSLKRRGREAEFEISRPIRTATSWLAGSLDFSEDDAALFQRTMRQMHAEGLYERIMKKYNLPLSATGK